MPIIDNQEKSSNTRVGVAGRQRNADIVEMETPTSTWEPSDPAMVRLSKLIGSLESMATRRQTVNAMIRAAQAIEAARQKNEISDADAKLYTSFLVDIAIMQPSYEFVSSTVDDFINQHLQPQLP